MMDFSTAVISVRVKRWVMWHISSEVAMITKNERKVLKILARFKLLNVNYWMRTPWIEPKLGAKTIFNWIKRRQKVDDLHHAPACPANHYHKARLVVDRCTCGAT